MNNLNLFHLNHSVSEDDRRDFDQYLDSFYWDNALSPFNY